jgi:4-oxalocrotonate tautomerase
MPLVNVKLLEGTLSDSQKRELIEKLTDVIVSVQGEAAREVTRVMIEEVKSGDFGVGGTPITIEGAEGAKAVAAGAQAAEIGRGV